MENKQIRVLLVDDHAIARNGVRLMLASEDHISVVGEAGNAQDALDLLQKQDFDVALVDITMPGKNGLDLLKSIQIKTPKLPVLILSTYSEEIYALRALKLGAAGYLTKDVQAADLVTAVNKVANGGKYISSIVADKLVSQLSHPQLTTHDSLTDRELEVMKLITVGMSLAKIAETLHLSPSTVTTYRTRILEKMGMSSNAELTRYALESHLI